MGPAAIHPRRWFRFRLRTLFIVLTLIALWLGLVAKSAREQQQAVEMVRGFGGKVMYAHQYSSLDQYMAWSIAVGYYPGRQPPEHWSPRWLRELVGEDYFQTVTYVEIPSAKAAGFSVEDAERLRLLPRLVCLNLSAPISDDALVHLAKLNHLEELKLHGANVTDAGLATLARMPRLHDLTIDGHGTRPPNIPGVRRPYPRQPNITDAGLASLSLLPSPRGLFLMGAPIDGSGFDAFAPNGKLIWHALSDADLDDAGLARLVEKFPNLEQVHFTATRITDPGMLHMARLTRLTNLNLNETRITDSGLRHIASLTKLRNLNLKDTRITDVGLQQLVGLKNLKTLYVENTDITDEGMAEFLEHFELHVSRPPAKPVKPETLRTLHFNGPRAGTARATNSTTP